MSPPRHPKPAVLSARVEATSTDSTKWARSAGGVGESLAQAARARALTSESCPWPTADRPTGIDPGTTSDHAHKELRNSNLDSLRSARSYEFVLCQRALRGVRLVAGSTTTVVLALPEDPASLMVTHQTRPQPARSRWRSATPVEGLGDIKDSRLARRGQHGRMPNEWSRHGSDAR